MMAPIFDEEGEVSGGGATSSPFELFEVVALVGDGFGEGDSAGVGEGGVGGDVGGNVGGDVGGAEFSLLK